MHYLCEINNNNNNNLISPCFHKSDNKGEMQMSRLVLFEARMTKAFSYFLYTPPTSEIYFTFALLYR